MKLQISNSQYIETNQAIDISIPLSAKEKTVSAWYCDPIKIEAVKTKNFIGDVNLGGSVNFRNISLNPHGNGTHTECVGHISKEFISLNNCLKEFHFFAVVISVSPSIIINQLDGKEDAIIEVHHLQSKLNNLVKNSASIEAIIIRTLPNETEKKQKNYSNSNPAFISKESVVYLNEIGINHLLIDTPSVDREVDNGILAAHHAFWNYPEDPYLNKTITEMIYVPNEVEDGVYLLNLQITSLENDASPSKPVLYRIFSNR